MDKKNRLTLSKYRFDEALEDLDTAKLTFQNGRLNRSYYAIFHAMRAVFAIEGFDSKKHSGVISHFNQYYVHTKIFDVITSDIIEAAFKERGNADYKDFYEVKEGDAQRQILNAEKFIDIIRPYLQECWAEMEK